MGQKVIIRFWWEAELSLVSKLWVHYECLRLCSAIVHFIRNNCLYLSAMADRKRWPHWLHWQFL